MKKMEMALMEEEFVLARFVGDDTGYRLTDPMAFPPHFDCARWVKAFVGYTTSEVWIDISKAYLFEEHDQAEGAT
jgi:hypothetical protein